MEIVISETKQLLGKKAARTGATLIRDAIQLRGEASIILATGASQFEMLDNLVKEDIDWKKIRAFHLDEYIGIAGSHPASFRKYLKERFADIVSPLEFIYINGNGNIHAECERLSKLINDHPVDVAFVGIGENSHLAFNDPPADFTTKDAFISVDLDEDCRRQQLREGWFHSFEEVPQKAISMSVNQIMKSDSIICSVPDLRKAEAVKKTVEGKISEDIPSSILRRHDHVWLFLDKESASLLKQSNYQGL
jgi:glucosamine-6-phosphate deaminase